MRFLRYPGGKRRLMVYIESRLPKDTINGRYIEPFVGGGAVFFHQKPERAILADLNAELIELYKAIKLYPHKVWEEFESLPIGKRAYYKVRDSHTKRSLIERAARTLYLNRTCFKGMWRHNPQGKFNVGYGGEDRRWAVTHENIVEVSRSLKSAAILHADFSEIFSDVKKGDFVFLDPPYKPGEKEFDEQHYVNRRFTYAEQIRLATTIEKVLRKKDFRWLMTNSAHPDIKRLYKGFKIRTLKIGTGSKPGIIAQGNNEVLISNY
jgi:DNA adenine methylase